MLGERGRVGFWGDFLGEFVGFRGIVMYVKFLEMVSFLLYGVLFRVFIYRIFMYNYLEIIVFVKVSIIFF